MEPNLEQLRKNYESFNDNKLIRIASEEATGLRCKSSAKSGLN